MNKILIVENDQSFIGLLKKTLSDFKDSDKLISVGSAAELETKRTTPHFWDDISLALIDLELGPGTTDTPGDFLGRDVVLPLLRDVAPYIPAVLVSRYIAGSRNALAAATPFGFDAVLSKDYFVTANTYIPQWKQLRHYAALNRNASQTGRHVLELDLLLKRQLTLEYGIKVKETVDSLDEGRVLNVLKLMDFGGDRLILDEIVMGFSGLNVVKATAMCGGRSTSWLIKIGSAVRKINDEITAHRRMVLDGLTRRLTVPAFFWRPVFWDGLGAIAYEYEPAFEDFLAYTRRVGPSDAFRQLQTALGQLYRDSAGTVAVPRNVLLEQYGSALSRLPSGRSYGLTIDALTKEKPNAVLDKSIHVLAGCQHGDFHGRNILATEHGMVFIDFAHYRASRDGIPLLDLTKLLTDCWAFDAATWTAANLADSSVLDDPSIHHILPLFWISNDTEISPDERSFFSLAAQCCLAVYTSYADLSIAKRTEALSVLAAS
jgi:CheY-like chemotaxis protein